MRLLDLFCGAGGAAMGYHRAGFDEIVGVDIKPQPRYPFSFVQADALEYVAAHGGEFDAIHASPPCQKHSTIGKQTAKRLRKDYPDPVATTRTALRVAGVPYIIENVIGAPLSRPLMLCGSSFGLDIKRHRLFEIAGFDVPLHPPCSHGWQTPRFRSLDKRRRGKLAAVVGVHGHINYRGEGALRREAMRIDWMDDYALTQAIPPAYTEFIGRQLLAVLNAPEEAHRGGVA